MATPQFLTDFQNSMTQLNNMRGQIEGKLQLNANFNRTLLEKLNSIRTLVQQLSDKITALKSNITGIQGRVDNNTRDIAAKESDCERLQNELRARESELQNIQRENANLAAQVRNGENAEQRIQELEQRLKQLQGELNEVRATTKNQGSQIQNQNQRMEELQRHLNECNRQKEELNNRIKEGDAAKTELASSKSKEATFSEENNAMKTQIANLNAQIAGLTKNNEFYKNKIIEATTALNTAIGYLNQFINSPPTQANLDELNRIVNDITQLINQISVVLDGNQLAPTPPPPGPRPPVTGASSVVPSFVPSNRLSSYRMKRKQEQNTNPYKGGKKSTKRTVKKRKYNKQKGGFTYKTNIKRKSVSTRLSSVPTSINSYQISSTRSVSDSARGRKRRGNSSRTRK